MGRPRQRSDEDLLKAVRAVVMRRGPGTSSKELAAAAGVSEGVLFQRFGTKAALVYAALRMPDFDVDALLTRAGKVADASGAREGLEELALGALEYLRQFLARMLPLFYFPQPEHLDEIAHGEHSALPRLAGALAAYLEQQQQRGRVHASNPRGTAMLLLSAMHTLATMEYLARRAETQPQADRIQDRERVRELMQALWEGLEPRAER